MWECGPTVGGFRIGLQGRAREFSIHSLSFISSHNSVDKWKEEGFRRQTKKKKSLKVLSPPSECSTMPSGTIRLCLLPCDPYEVTAPPMLYSYKKRKSSLKIKWFNNKHGESERGTFYRTPDLSLQQVYAL